MDYFTKLFESKKEEANLANVWKDFLKILSNLNEFIIQATSDKEVLTPICLRCECIKEKGQILYGCTDKHIFDIVTPSYFTLGVIIYLFTDSIKGFLILFTIWRLMRTCGNVNEKFYHPSPIKQRKYPTLLNILGDIFAITVGHLFFYTLSWIFVLPTVVLLNLFAIPQGGDFISFLCWCIDRCGLTVQRKRYLNQTPLEKFHLKK